MFQINGANFPKTPGGYNIETYEPAVIQPERKKITEDLVRMAFTDKKPTPTIRRIVQRKPQLNIRPNPIINGVNINQIQNQRIIYNNPNQRRFQIINKSPTNIYRNNNIKNNINPNNVYINQHSYIHQNLIRINSPNPVVQNKVVFQFNPGHKYLVSNLKFQKPRPIMRSNSATLAYNALLRPRIFKQNMFNGPNYKLYVYKTKLK